MKISTSPMAAAILFFVSSVALANGRLRRLRQAGVRFAKRARKAGLDVQACVATVPADPALAVTTTFVTKEDLTRALKSAASK